MNRTRLLALMAAVLFTLGSAAGCARKGGEEFPVKPGQTWNVYKGDRKVLIVKNEPGPILSTAMLPPGTPPAKHPFLTGSALYSQEENALREILDRSRDFEDFLKRLKNSGYRLEEGD